MHVDTKKLQIRFTGLRQGEKLNEDLFSKSEQRTPTAHPKITATVPPAIAADFADRLDALIFAASANRPPYEIKYYLSHVLPEYRPPQEVLGENGNGHFAYLYPDDF
jgi:FlaA1/EpsC-like NDP-sugar epimerase